MRREKGRVARRVTTIQDGDILTLTRADRTDDISITWRDAVSQIIGSVANARQAMVDAYSSTLAIMSMGLEWVEEQLAQKAPLDHTHQMAQVLGLVDALAGKATRADITAAINALVAASPGTLDTLKELADALGDDPHFATTMTNLLAQKATPADIATAIAAEVTARNNAITTAINAEAAARAYADTQEGLARVAGDNALDLRVTAMENTRTKKFAADFGNGVLTSFTFNHGLGSADLIVQVYAKSSGLLLAPATVSRTSTQVTITFVLAVGANANRIVVIG